jgi:hypothetical protein
MGWGLKASKRLREDNKGSPEDGGVSIRLKTPKGRAGFPLGQLKFLVRR